MFCKCVRGPGPLNSAMRQEQWMETGIPSPLNEKSAKSDLFYDSISHFTSFLTLIKMYNSGVGRNFWGTGSGKENWIYVFGLSDTL